MIFWSISSRVDPTSRKSLEEKTSSEATPRRIMLDIRREGAAQHNLASALESKKNMILVRNMGQVKR